MNIDAMSHNMQNNFNAILSLMKETQSSLPCSALRGKSGTLVFCHVLLLPNSIKDTVVTIFANYVFVSGRYGLFKAI